MNPERLYIIGNGFDMYHKLDTSYQSFGFYLQKHHGYEIYELLIDYFGLTDLDEDEEESKWDSLWSEFEQRLADINFDQILEDNSDYVGNAAISGKARDWHAYEQVMDDIVERITVKLRAAFKSFILQVSFSPSTSSLKLTLDSSAAFFTFNYTDTLQRYYGIPESNILHIHNQASGTDELVLGHGTDPSIFDEPDELPPDGLTDEEMMEWEDRMSEQYDFSFERGKDALKNYYSDSHKTTESIIDNNQSFFNSLKDLKEVFVLGHSLAEVDRPYFRKIISSTNDDVVWTVTYYSDADKTNHFDALVSLGINRSQIRMIRMEELR